MADIRTTQKVTASLTYKVDCAGRLAAAYPGQTITISSATGTATSPAVLTSASGSGTSLTFHLATSAVSPATSPDVLVTMNATLSNGDVDPITIAFGVTV